ncbi:hypothetical protein COB87_002985 [Candidatus Wolfebacteria bacterium]|nr:hypothetical protein [Candidatus Wolfebacteria bacterium]
MKKTWRRKRSIISIPPFFLIAGGVLFFGWAFVSAFSHVSPGSLENIFARSSGIQSAAGSATQSFLSVFKDKSGLVGKVKRLEDSELALQLQLQINSFTQEENKELRELLDFIPQEGVLGSVLAWPPKTAYDTLLVEAGKEVSVGDLVLGRGIAPIGLVHRMEGKYAYVRLFSQANVVTQVRAGVDKIPLELTGRGGGSAFIVAPKDVPVERGDEIFFPYNGNTFIGRIGAVETSPSSSTKQLWIVFPKHFYAYTWVSIVPYP